ncbi:MAG: hypothetical protein JO257_17700 [Deltaproteobacteria bacterium]|nr:hypothetical protein [Deltaproteobacteria bacterium]
MIVTAPAGWTGGASRELVEQTGREGHLGGVHGVVEAERWDAPGGGLVLYATRVMATTAAPGDAAAAEVAMVHHPVTADHVVDGLRVVETAWTEGDVHGAGRLVIAASADRIVAVSGECYAGGGQPLTACSAALATLSTGIEPKDRVAIPEASRVPAAPQLTTPGPSATHVTMPPVHLRQEAHTDLRPVYVGAGLIVIAAVFWWNRKRAAHGR